MQISLNAALSWPEPNLENPETLAPGNTVLISIFHVILTALLAIRLYTRRTLSGGLGADDLLIVLAYIPATLFAAAGIHQELVLKIDRHIWDFPSENSVDSWKSAFAVGILFAAATTLTKLSMLAIIYRITSAAGDRISRWLVVIVTAIVAIDGAVFIIVELTQCTPLDLFWTLSFKPQNCIKQADHLLAAGVINTVTDFIIVLLPIKTILSLKLPRRQLIGIQVLLGGGVLATIAGAVRVYFTWLSHASPDGDVTWRGHLVISLSVLELYISIACASLPATKPFFDRMVPRLFGNSRFMRVNELGQRNQRRKHEDDESAIGSANLGSTARRSWASGQLNPPSLPPPPAYTRTARKVSERSNAPFLPYVGTQEQRFAWKPIISAPIIKSPIAPTFRIVPLASVTQPAPVMTAPPRQMQQTRPATIHAMVTNPINSNAQLLNLNKPLPMLHTEQRSRASSKTQSSPVRESPIIQPLRPPPPITGNGSSPDTNTRRAPSNPPSSTHSSRVYDFIAYDDGRISVHKTPRFPSE